MPSDTDPGMWLREPDSPEVQRPFTPSDLAWHYTNPAGLAGVLESGSLWAGGTGGLNDFEEVKFGVDEVARVWATARDRLKESAPKLQVDEWLSDAAVRARSRRVFVVSACGSGDNLVHWRGYTPQGKYGYSLGFDPAIEFKLFGDSTLEELFQPDDVPSIYWREVYYGVRDVDFGWSPYEDPTRRLIDNALSVMDGIARGRFESDELALLTLDRQYLATVYCMKHGSWIAEEEIRLVVVAPPFEGWVRERQGVFGPTEYVVLRPGPDGDVSRYTTSDSERLPLRKIFLGPWNDPTDANAVEKLLAQHGYHGVEVARSTATIR